MYKIYVDGSLFCSSEIEELAIINPEIDQEINKAGTFTFTIPPTHPYYNTIKKRTSLIDVYRDEDAEPIFEGVCIDSTVDFYKQKKLTCEGELTFFNDSNLRPQKYQDKTPRQLLESYVSQHNAQTENMKHFTVGQVTISDSNLIFCYSNYNSTMVEIKEDLVDDFGGFLRTRHVEGVRYIDYLASSPRTSNQVIRLGENLLDLSQNIDTEDIATIIIPLGATLETQSIAGLDERLTIKTAAADSQHPSGADYVYSSDAVSNYGYIEKVVVWDDVTTVAALLAKGKAYLSDIQFENLIIQAKAVDLGLTSDEFNKFRLLDSIRVVSAPHGLDRYFLLSKLQIHLNNPENDTITLGIEEPNTLSAKSQSANESILKKIEELPTSNMVQSAIDNATALITGSQGGYVVIVRNNDGQPIEIRIQDALNNPTKIWRWNQNGFGYSNDGGQTYGTAITMNGAIVADYITSGTMSAARIRGGELLVGGSGVAANGSITVKDSSNNTIVTIDSSGVDLKKGTIKGPSIELGGNSNVNGTLTIKNASGTVIGTWNKDGLTVVGGTIQGANISSECVINTPKFQVDGAGSIYGHGSLYMDGNLSGYVVDARNGLNVLGGDGGGLAVTKGASVGEGLYVGGNISTNTMEIRGSGFVSLNCNGKAAATEFITTSDAKLKKDVKTLDFAEKILDKLRPITYRYNKKAITDDSIHVGLIAQEVEAACGGLSEIFVSDMGDNTLGVIYMAFVPLLIKAYQEQKKELEELKKEIKS